MNWFLLLLILKLFTTNWSAPIDLVENRETIQQDKELLDNLINKGFSVADEANNLLQTTEVLVNGTINSSNSSAVNESINENFHKIEEDLHNFSSELQKELENNPAQDETEVRFELKPNDEEINAQVTEISSFDMASPKKEVQNEGTLSSTQNLMETSTENVEEISADTDSMSNTLNPSETLEAAQDLNKDTLISNTEVIVENLDHLANQSQNLLNNSQQESVFFDKQSVDIQDSTNSNNVQESLTPEVHEVRVQSESSSSIPIEHLNQQLQQNSDFAPQSSTENTQNVEHEIHTSDSTALKETVDTLAQELLNVASIIQTSTENSNISEDKVSVNEKMNEAEIITDEHLEKTPSFREAVDSFIDDVVEIGSKLGFITEQTSEKQLVVDQDSQIQITSANPIENSTEQHEQSTEYPLSTTNNNESEAVRPEVTTISNVEEETSTETPAIRETIDSFINQVANIGNSLGETAKEIINDADMVKPEADNSSNPILVNETNTNLEQSETQNLGDSNEKVPTFKQAVDAFIEDVVEIGSKLGLVPEQQPTDEQVSETTEQKNETLETTDVSELNVSNSNLEQTTDSLMDQADEIAPTTVSPMETLSENPQSIFEANQNTDNSNFGRSAETLIQAASEIGNNFSEAVSGLFSLSETVTEITNESSTEITILEEQNKSENLQNAPEISISNVSTENNLEISSTTEQPNENFAATSEDSLKALDEKHDAENIHVAETENFNGQVVKENIAEQKLEEAKPKEEVQSAQFVEYIPVAVITIPEEETESQQSLNPVQNETDQLHSATKSTGDEVQLNNENIKSEGEVTINTESKITQNEVQGSQTLEATQPEELSTTYSSTEAEPSTSEPSKTEEQTTSSPIVQETSTQAHTAVIEKTTNAFNKFENTLKTLIEQEKLKQQEKHLSTLETSQQETTTLAPNSKTFTTVKEESNTLLPQDETTMLPKKFEEELQMAVKALEETTHHHFEEFQNNLKQAFKKFTVWGAEHERQGEATTIKNNIEETTQNTTEQPSTIKTEEESTTTDMVVETTLNEDEEPHRIGAINQKFVDKFSDNYQENTEIINTEEQTEKEVSNVDTYPEKEQTTDITFTLTTTMSPVEEDEDVKSNQDNVTNVMETTTLPNIDDKNPTSTAENNVKEHTEEALVTTENISETTIMPLLARVPLHKDITSISLTTGEETATETFTQEKAVTQQHETEQLKETHKELTQTHTTQPTESTQETITLSSPESYPTEMVTFIEHHEDTTTVKQRENEEVTTKEVEDENTAKSQTQEPLTQAAFMEEQQQQIESTTEHEAQTQTAAASGQTAATTANIEDDTMVTQQQQQQQQQQQEQLTTTEKEIYSTTVVEKEEENETTVAPITSTTANAAVEPEPRSLALPPPKLEYLQNEDGVEIFYGYSIVKHN